MAAKNPTGKDIPPLKAPDPKEIALPSKETAKHQRIADAHHKKLIGRNISGSQPKR